MRGLVGIQELSFYQVTLAGRCGRAMEAGATDPLEVGEEGGDGGGGGCDSSKAPDSRLPARHTGAADPQNVATKAPLVSHYAIPSEEARIRRNPALLNPALFDKAAADKRHRPCARGRWRLCDVNPSTKANERMSGMGPRGQLLLSRLQSQCARQPPFQPLSGLQIIMAPSRSRVSSLLLPCVLPCLRFQKGRRRRTTNVLEGTQLTILNQILLSADAAVDRL